MTKITSTPSHIVTGGYYGDCQGMFAADYFSQIHSSVSMTAVQS